MAKLLKIAKTEDVVPGQAAAFTIEGQKIALFNVEGTYYAIGDTCTHRGGPLSEGDVRGTRITCPWHGADFDLKTGAVLGPPAQKGVPSYKVVVEGDDIKVEVWNQRSRRNWRVSPTKVRKVHRNLLRSSHSGPHPGTSYRPIRVTGVGRPLDS